MIGTLQRSNKKRDSKKLNNYVEYDSSGLFTEEF